MGLIIQWNLMSQATGMLKYNNNRIVVTYTWRYWQHQYCSNTTAQDVCCLHHYSSASIETLLTYIKTYLDYRTQQVLNITPQVESKKNLLMTGCWEKPQKCMCLSNVLTILPSLSGLTEVWHYSWIQLSLKVSSVKALSLRGNPQRVYIEMGCLSTQDFTVANLTWRYLNLLKMRICNF